MLSVKEYYIKLYFAGTVVSCLVSGFIYYYYRLKDKFFFDCAGKKYVNVQSEREEILREYMVILKNDDVKGLQDGVRKYTISCLYVKDKNNRTLIDLAKKEGKKKLVKGLNNFDQ